MKTKRKEALHGLVEVSSDRCHRCNAHLSVKSSVAQGFGEVCLQEVLGEVASKIYYSTALRAAGVNVEIPFIKKKGFSDLGIWKRNKALIEGW